MTEFGPLDTGFMELEDNDRHVSVAIAAVAIVEGSPPSRERFQQAVADGLLRYERLRQRVRRVPWDLGAPAWEDDPNFDLAHHIRWAALPEPPDEAALQDLMAAELPERLDRDHPLWRVVVVDHLVGNRWAVIVKAHHSMVDGISGINVFESICDSAANVPVDATPASPDGRAGPSLGSMAGQVIRLPYSVPRFAVHTVRTLLPVLAAAMTPSAESSLNGPLGRQRRYAIAQTSLPEIREVCAAFDVTVNDVAVAALAGAYRGLLLKRNEPPVPGMLRVLIPVSTRAVDAKTSLGNQISVMLAFLPADIDDPVGRLRAVHERIARHRSRGEAEAETSLLSLADRLPAGVSAWAFRLATRFPQRGVSVLATNVPGPRHHLTLAGGRVQQIWPCIPVAMRLRTTVAFLSYADHLIFGITGDFDSTPDIAVIASGITTEIAALLRHARATSR